MFDRRYPAAADVARLSKVEYSGTRPPYSTLESRATFSSVEASREDGQPSSRRIADRMTVVKTHWQNRRVSRNLPPVRREPSRGLRLTAPYFHVARLPLDPP